MRRTLAGVLLILVGLVVYVGLHASPPTSARPAGSDPGAAVAVPRQRGAEPVPPQGVPEAPPARLEGRGSRAGTPASLGAVAPDGGEPTPPPRGSAAPEAGPGGAGRDGTAEGLRAGSPSPAGSVAERNTSVRLALTGTVRDPTGRPLPAIPLSLLLRASDTPSPAEVRTLGGTTSDANGRFQVTWAAPAGAAAGDGWLRTLLVARHPDYVLAARDVHIRIDRTPEALTDQDLHFQHPFTVVARVLDEADAPLEGARLQWRSIVAPGPFLPEGHRPETTTDPDGVGRLVLPVLEGPTSLRFHGVGFVVQARAEGRASATSERLRVMQVGPGTTFDVTIHLPRRDTLHGRVLDDREFPLTNATLQITARRGRVGPEMLWADREGNAASTDTEGAFAVEDFPAGEWELEVEAPGHASCTFPLRAGERDVLVHLDRHARAAFTYIDDATGGSLAVHGCVQSWGAGADRRTWNMGWDGSSPLRLEGLRPGSLSLQVAIPGRLAPFVHEFELKPGDSRVETIRVPSLGRGVLCGEIRVEGGGPASNADLILHGASRVEVETPFHDHESIRQRTDSCGRFRFGELAPDTYTLEVRAAGHPRVLHETLVTDAVDAEPLRLDLPAAARLVLRLHPAPAAERWSFQPRLVRPESGAGVGRRAPQGPGRWSFEDLPSGTLRLVWDTTTFCGLVFPEDPYATDLVLTPGQAQELVLPAPAVVTLRGRLEDSEGVPLPQTRLPILRIGPDTAAETARAVSGQLQTSTTANDGTFEIPGLLPGRYLLPYFGDGGVVRHVEFQIDARPEQEIVLRRP